METKKATKATGTTIPTTEEMIEEMIGEVRAMYEILSANINDMIAKAEGMFLPMVKDMKAGAKDVETMAKNVTMPKDMKTLAKKMEALEKDMEALAKEMEEMEAQKEGMVQLSSWMKGVRGMMTTMRRLTVHNGIALNLGKNPQPSTKRAK